MQWHLLQLKNHFSWPFYLAYESQNRRSKLPVKPNYTTPVYAKTNEKKVVSTPIVKTGYNTNRNSLYDQRRAMGLCVKCGDKYFPGR